MKTAPFFVDTIVALLEPVIVAVWGAHLMGERRGPGEIAARAVLGAIAAWLRPERDESEPIR